MLGFLDELKQAFLTVDIGQGPLDFQVDTAFIGTLLVGEELFDPSEAIAAGKVQADLAATLEFEFPQYLVAFEWLGQVIEAHILIGPGKECLLGTEFLSPHRLEIDYEARTVKLIPNPNW